mgnify:CR=1 FL=1
MYQPKINSTEKYSDGQGEYIVCRGKLLLLDTSNQYSESYPETIDFDMGQYIHEMRPIIISETEQIKTGNWVYNSKSKEIYQITEKPFVEYEHKILVLPAHFSNNHLQAIADGKIEEGDEVLVKCNRYGISGQSNYQNHDRPIQEVVKQIHLDQQDNITLFTDKQSLEEAAWDYVHSADSGDPHTAFIKGGEWMKRNL